MGRVGDFLETTVGFVFISKLRDVFLRKMTSQRTETSSYSPSSLYEKIHHSTEKKSNGKLWMSTDLELLTFPSIAG